MCIWVLTKAKFSFISIQKFNFFFPGPICEICGKVFTHLKNLKQHQRSIHEKSTLFSCIECDYTTPRKSNLKRHAKRHTHLTPNLPPKIARHDPFPNIIEPPANDHLLEQLENQEIESMFNQNTQVGFGITQMTSTDENIPHEIQQFFRDEQIEIFAKFMSKIFLEFAIRKPLTDDPEFTSIIPIPHSLNPLSMPLKIFFIDKPTHSR